MNLKCFFISLVIAYHKKRKMSDNKSSKNRKNTKEEVGEKLISSQETSSAAAASTVKPEILDCDAKCRDRKEKEATLVVRYYWVVGNCISRLNLCLAFSMRCLFPLKRELEKSIQFCALRESLMNPQTLPLNTKSLCEILAVQKYNYISWFL